MALEGTYLWQYSEDLSKREGEGVATQTQGWVQPPGTPEVGLAFRAAWGATCDLHHFDAARETAYGFISGQLRSAGWTYVVDTSPMAKASYPENRAHQWPGSEKYWFRYTFNDNSLAETIELMLLVEEVYATEEAEKRFIDLAERCRAAAEMAGDIILLPQMPSRSPRGRGSSSHLP